MSQYRIEQDDTVAAQAFLELAEANVSLVADAGAWAAEVGFLQESDVERDATDQVGVGDVLADVSLLA